MDDFQPINPIPFTGNNPNVDALRRKIEAAATDSQRATRDETPKESAFVRAFRSKLDTARASTDASGVPHDIAGEFAKLHKRMADLEQRVRQSVDPEAIKAALEDHPTMTEFREFLDKWRNR